MEILLLMAGVAGLALVAVIIVAQLYYWLRD